LSPSGQETGYPAQPAITYLVMLVPPDAVEGDAGPFRFNVSGAFDSTRYEPSA
jgi:hypothetical protein